FKVTTQSIKVTGYELITENVDSIRKGLLVYTPKTFTDYSEKLYRSFDNKWKREFFNDKNGGYLVIHKNRITASKINKNELQKFEKEYRMVKNLANSGYRIEMLEEVPRISSPDMLFNGIKADLKSVSSHNNIIKYADDAINKQGAE